jgi:hypothetical protein
MYPSNENLDNALEYSLTLVALLTELKTRRSKDITHKALIWELVHKGKFKGRISEVDCSCGEKTIYKVPLRLISDFECKKASHGKV